MATYREWLPTTQPTWFRKPVGVALKFLGAIELQVDGLMQGCVEAVNVRNLFIGPDDALPRAGRDSSLPRFPNEPPPQHRARLLRRWEDWPAAGTELGLLGQFSVIPQTATAEIKENFDWNWDGDAANWSRFWVVIPQPHPWIADGVWDGPEPYGATALWDDGGVWDSENMTPEEVAAVRDIPQRFKPVHVVCVHIILVLDNAAWLANQPDGTWGNPLNRNPNAIYLSGWDGG